MQPWRVHVLTGEPKERLSAALVRAHAEGAPHGAEYKYYPDQFFEPYLARRRKVGWDLYGLLGIARGETARMQAQHARNLVFFDAPVGMIFTIDRGLEIGSWLDYGIFLGNVMTAARGHGLHTCAQAAFAPFHATIRRELGLADEEVVVCGLSIGYEDTAAPENALAGRSACRRAISRAFAAGREGESDAGAQSRIVGPSGVARRSRLQQFRRPDRPRGDPQGRPQGARSRHHALRHRRRLRRARRLGALPRRSPRRAPQGHRAGDEVRHGHGRCRPHEGRLARLRHEGGRGQPAAAQDRLDRPLPAPPRRPADADRGDAARPRRPHPPGQGPLHRLLEPRRLAGGRGAVDGRRRGTSMPSPRARTSTASSCATSSASSCRRSRRTGWGCCRSSRWRAGF